MCLYIFTLTLYNDIVFPFGIDPDTGDYGYIKAGADTVTPFKSGGGSTPLLICASDKGRDPSAIFDLTPVINSAYFTKEAYNRVAINQSCVVDVVLMGRGGSNSTVQFYSGPTKTPTTLLIQGSQNLVLYPNISLTGGYYIKSEMSGGSSSQSTFAAFCTIYLHED